MKLLKTICLGAIALFSNITIANTSPEWGNTGHRTVGEIASQHLTRRAKRNIAKLLKGQSLAMVANYADDIKSDKKYNKYKPWHYANMNLEEDYHHSHKNEKGDVVQSIALSKKVLLDKNSSAEEKRFSLKMIVHLMGDLHQPMHLGQRADKGGNTIQVKWFYKGSNLHRVWDSGMIDRFNMGYLELANNREVLTKKQIKNIQKGDVKQWVNEIHELTKKVYANVKSGDKLGYRYMYDNFTTVRTQLQKAGLRLAKILNEIYA